MCRDLTISVYMLVTARYSARRVDVSFEIEYYVEHLVRRNCLAPDQLGAPAQLIRGLRFLE